MCKWYARLGVSFMAYACSFRLLLNIFQFALHMNTDASFCGSDNKDSLLVGLGSKLWKQTYETFSPTLIIVPLQVVFIIHTHKLSQWKPAAVSACPVHFLDPVPLCCFCITVWTTLPNFTFSYTHLKINNNEEGKKHQITIREMLTKHVTRRKWHVLYI